MAETRENLHVKPKRKRLNDFIDDDVACAIYYTHWKEGCPVWEALTDEARDWIRKQARNAIAAARKL